MINATQKREAYNTTGIVMLELQATDNDDAWHMAQEKHVDPEESYRRIRVKTSASQLRKLMKKEIILFNDKIDEIASLSEEDY